MSIPRQLLLHRRGVVDKEMQKAMQTAAAPYLAEMREIDAALSAIGTLRTTSASEAETENDPSTGANDAGNTSTAKPRDVTRAVGLTLKEMILLTLRARHHGADALTILDEINTRWNVGLERTSLSPQLSRLKNEGKLKLNGKVWHLAQQDEAPDAETSRASSVGVAGSPAVPEKVSPTGSTPVASTTPLFPSQDREEVP